MDINKAIKNYKYMQVRVYDNATVSFDKIRLVITVSKENDDCDILKNMTIPKSYINANGIIVKLLKKYNGNHIEEQNSVCTVIRFSTNKKEVFDWIESLELIYTLAN